MPSPSAASSRCSRHLPGHAASLSRRPRNPPRSPRYPHSNLAAVLETSDCRSSPAAAFELSDCRRGPPPPITTADDHRRQPRLGQPPRRRARQRTYDVTARQSGIAWRSIAMYCGCSRATCCTMRRLGSCSTPRTRLSCIVVVGSSSPRPRPRPRPGDVQLLLRPQPRPPPQPPLSELERARSCRRGCARRRGGLRRVA